MHPITLRGAAGAALFVAAALPAAPSSAQEDRPGVGLAPIVIESLRLPQVDREAGTSVAVITAEDIEELGVDMAVDAISTASGVTFYRQGGFGGQAQVSIRGAPTDQTLVLIDGVPLNDPTQPAGGFDFARLDPASIERIEILKGPQSTLWGSDAVGGVVAITTKRGEGVPGGSAFAEYGSFATSRAGVSFGGAFEGGSFRADAVRVASGGISAFDEADGNPEDDPYRSLAASVAGHFDLPGDARLEAAARSSDAEYEYDSSFNIEHENRTRERSGNLVLDLPTLGGRFENRLLVGASRIERRERNDGSGPTTLFYKGDRLVYRYQGTLGLDGRGRLAFGAEREQIAYRTGPAVFQSSREDHRTDVDGAFGLVEFRPYDHLTLTAGVRSDDHKRFGQETTGRAAVSWRPSRRIALRGSWGEGFKAPTISQTANVCSSAMGPLRPETSGGFDLGAVVTTADGRGELEVAHFRQETEDPIDYHTGSFCYVNIREIKASGVEIDARYRPATWFETGFAYTYTDATQSDYTDAVESRRRLRVPRHAADLRATARFGTFAGTILVRHHGGQLDISSWPRTTRMPGWIRVDLSFQYRLDGGLEAFGRVENLFNHQYQQVRNYGTPGRSASAGLRVRY